MTSDCQLSSAPLTALLIVASLACFAGAQPQPCLKDADGDGHPIFALPQMRTNPEWPPTGTATSMRLGDVDGDGRPDAIIAGFSAWSVHRGKGDGTFEPIGLPYKTGVEPTLVELGDFDRDGDLDAAVLCTNGFGNDSHIWIHWNLGDGTFKPYAAYPVGLRARALGVGDLNGDGRPDMVALNTDSVDVSVLINAGIGFFPEQRYAAPLGNVTFAWPIPEPAPQLVLFDVEGDGDLDVGVPSSSQLGFLLNNGQGGLSPSPLKLTVPTFSEVYCPIAADLDGDGDLDLAASIMGAGPRGCVWKNLGNGVFASGQMVDANPSHPWYVNYCETVVAGDVDNDRDVDLAFGYYGAQCALVRNKGDGTFDPPEIYLSVRESYGLALADLTGDGRVELCVLSNIPLGRITTLINNGAGQFYYDEVYPEPPWPPVTPPYAAALYQVALADLDLDGDLDAVLGGQGGPPDKFLTLWWNDGAGRFPTSSAVPQGFPTNFMNQILVGRLNADPWPDLVVVWGGPDGGFKVPSSVFVYLTSKAGGPGVFAPPVEVKLDPWCTSRGELTDLDGDGDLDLLLTMSAPNPGNDETPVTQGVMRLFNDSQGGFGPVQALPMLELPAYNAGHALHGDVNEDGIGDLVGIFAQSYFPAPKPSRVVLALGQPGGSFAVKLPVLIGSVAAKGVWVPDGLHDPSRLLVGHNSFPNDADPQPSYLTDLRFDGSNLAVHRAYASSIDRVRGSKLRLVDFNRDKRLDALMVTQNDTAISIAMGQPGGTFAFPGSYGTLSGTNLDAGDLDGDGAPDILGIGHPSHNMFFVKFNRSCPPAPQCPADCDGDAALTIDDFICFQTFFVIGDLKADCDADGTLTIDDFICFQTSFVLGC